MHRCFLSTLVLTSLSVFAAVEGEGSRWHLDKSHSPQNSPQSHSTVHDPARNRQQDLGGGEERRKGGEEEEEEEEEKRRLSFTGYSTNCVCLTTGPRSAEV